MNQSNTRLILSELALWSRSYRVTDERSAFGHVAYAVPCSRRADRYQWAFWPLRQGRGGPKGLS